MPRIKIQCGKDRDNVVIALASAGYMVRIYEVEDLLHTDYYVEYEDEEDVHICACALKPTYDPPVNMTVTDTPKVEEWKDDSPLTNS